MSVVTFSRIVSMLLRFLEKQIIRVLLYLHLIIENKFSAEKTRHWIVGVPLNVSEVETTSFALN